MPDFVYGWGLWELNFLHAHPALWWSMVAIVMIPQLLRLRG